jgi:hypothetical protein
MRPAIINMCYPFMSEAHVVELSGHDSPHASAMHQYIRNVISRCFPAAAIAAGHDPLPRDASGNPPVPATLDALTLGPEFLDGLIDDLYNINRYVASLVCM